MKWKKQKRNGGNCDSWFASIDHQTTGVPIHICTIKKFEPNEYCLPDHWFPRKGKRYMPQRTKTLPEAKKKCEKWFNDFISHCYQISK